MSPVVTMKALLESGVHFGHRSNKWNPKMRKYIFTERNGIHIIDLQQTVQLLQEAYDFVRDTVAEGGTILFVGTKRQAQDTVREEASRCGMPYVSERWLGGTITNWITIQKRIFELERLERMRDSGELELLTKKEGLMIEREIERLEYRLSGIRNMQHLPSLLYVVDISREETAVHEANLKEIPVIAMVDTNCDPRNVDYIIPSNDDAIRAIKLLVGKMADAVMEGKAIYEKEADEDERLAEKMPVEVSQFIDDDDELEDEVLLGESTLKHLGSSRKAEAVEEEEPETAEEEVQAGTVEDEEDEAEAVEEELETVEEEIESEAVEEEVDPEAIEEEEPETVEEEIESEAEEEEVEPEAVEEEEPETVEEEEPETVEDEEDAAETDEEEAEAETVEEDIESEAVEEEVEPEAVEEEPETDEEEVATEEAAEPADDEDADED